MNLGIGSQLTIGNKRYTLCEETSPAKKQKVALYLDDDTPVRTIEVTNFGDDIDVDISSYLCGFFEHAARRISTIQIVNEPQDDGKQIRKAYVTFVIPEDAAKLICDPNLQLNYKFNIKQAGPAYQPKLRQDTPKKKVFGNGS